MKRILLIFFILAIGFSAVQAQLPVLTITILHSNDFHGADLDSLARRATVIKRIRAESGYPVLLLDAGDIFARGRYAKRFHGELEFAVMNELEYDAATLGNNEFKATDDLLAWRYLTDRIDQARFPLLCANVVDRKTGNYIPGVQPYIIKEVEGVRIGIFGVTTLKIESYQQLKGWKVLDPIGTAKRVLRELEGKADLVIALTHIGYDTDLVLAHNLSNLGAIVGGDSHTALSEPVWVDNQPIVQAGDYGYYVVKLYLIF
jgi:5'-nucleotidase/UDP-sugar diphosphatase